MSNTGNGSCPLTNGPAKIASRISLGRWLRIAALSAAGLSLVVIWLRIASSVMVEGCCEVIVVIKEALRATEARHLDVCRKVGEHRSKRCFHKSYSHSENTITQNHPSKIATNTYNVRCYYWPIRTVFLDSRYSFSKLNTPEFLRRSGTRLSIEIQPLPRRFVPIPPLVH